MMSLYELLKSIDVIKSLNEKDIEIKGIAYHSGKVRPGDLFVCIKGYKTDGHRYIAEAIKKGAVAVVVEDLQPDLDIPQFCVSDSRKALAALSAVYYDNPSQALEVIGISATNGKTSTAFMTNAILEKHRLETGLIGTVMVKFETISSLPY